MRKLTTTLLGLLITVVILAQQPTSGKQTVAQLKQSPAGSKVLAVIKAINKTGDEVTDDFVKKYFSPGVIERNSIERLKNILSTDISENDGMLTIYEVNRKDKFSYEIHAQGSKGLDWLKLGFNIEKEAPYRIEGITLDAGGDGPTKVGKPLEI